MTGAASPLPQTATIIVAGGSGSRAGLALPKQYAPYRGTTVLAFNVKRVREAVRGPIVVVIPEGDELRAREAIGNCDELFFATGGTTRQESVRSGLRRLGELGRATSNVLVHDCARPDLPPEVVRRLLERLGDVHGAVPVLPMADSVVSSRSDMLGDVLDRDGLRRVQTPQAFITASLNLAHEQWRDPPDAGDDATVMLAAGMEVALVEGHERLHKLTFAEDFAQEPVQMRVGTGFDVHRLESDEELWLCGVKIDHHCGLSGHSDADVAIHALVDAMLGAVGAGDIGEHFPPSDTRWRGAASRQFLAHAAKVVEQHGYRLGNADLTIICEAPKLGPHREAMRRSLAEILSVDIAMVSVKATTTERLGFTGRGEGIAAQAAVSLIRC